MSEAATKYLATVDAPQFTTIDEFTDALVSFINTGNTFMAQLALEGADLSLAHAAEAARRQKLPMDERTKGDQAKFWDSLETARQRIKFLQDRWGQASELHTALVASTHDLRDSREAVRTTVALVAASEIVAAPAEVTP